MSFFHMTYGKDVESLLWGLALKGEEADGKTFTDPWKMMMLTVAIYQQLHKKEEKNISFS